MADVRRRDRDEKAADEGQDEEDEEEVAFGDIPQADGTLKDRIEMLESRIIQETLIRHRWNKSKAARELGLSRVGLRGKLERYGLEKVQPMPARRTAGAV